MAVLLSADDEQGGHGAEPCRYRGVQTQCRAWPPVGLVGTYAGLVVLELRRDFLAEVVQRGVDTADCLGHVPHLGVYLRQRDDNAGLGRGHRSASPAWERASALTAVRSSATSARSFTRSWCVRTR